MATRSRRRAAKPLHCSDLPDLVKLWLLRLLVPLGCHQEFVGQIGFRNDTLAEALGLGGWIDSSAREFDLKDVRIELRRLHAKAERQFLAAVAPRQLAGNTQRLAKLVGLSKTECRILEFAVLLHSECLLEDVADWLGDLSSTKVYRALAIILDQPEGDIRTAFSAQGVLERSGLVMVDRRGSARLRRKMDLLGQSFADRMLSCEDDPVSLLRDTVTLSKPPHLTLDDFDHIAQSLAVVRPYLQQAVATKRRGVNIFLHGAPGTGKSQLVKVLARVLGCELFEVASEDEDGDPADGEIRLRAYRAAQSFFAQREALILFDEVEDVFNDGHGVFGRKSTAQTRKAWINRMLEENPVPALWLSNSVRCLDPAFVRRFDLVVELPVPPKKQRERIVTEACGGLLPAQAIRRIAEAESLAPAIITRAVSVIRTIEATLPENEIAGAIEHIIGNTLEAQGHASLKRADAHRLPDFYDPAFIHADVDLAAVAAGIGESRSARLCLYGPPGTGKTAFGRWLADTLDMPLHIKKASDLLSMWVGGTEKNLARVFLEAERDGALLLVDEVDSFLQDRRGAQRPWEVSGVNEMLTQMESFPGVLIASTNLMEGLDQAALRRFDLKVKFGYLKADQTRALFERQCGVFSIGAPSAELQRRLACLNTLTPGDFAAVARQHRFSPIRTAGALVAALEQECAIKEGGRKMAIGFI